MYSELHTFDIAQLHFQQTSPQSTNIFVKIGRKHKNHRKELQSGKGAQGSSKGKAKDKARGGRRNEMGQDESRPMVDESTPPQTLDDRSIEAVAKYIKDGQAKKICVMVCSRNML